MSYAHIIRNERLSLGTLVRYAEYTQQRLADHLGVDQSSISRELSRNKDADGNYGYGWSADRKAKERRMAANQHRRKLGVDAALTKYVIKYLKKYWSPEQISGRLKYEARGYQVSSPTIYAFIYSKHPELVKYLRLKKSTRRRRYGTKKGSLTRFESAGKRSIEVRPKEVEERAELGHWEGDTMVGKGKDNKIHTHVERKSGYLLSKKLQSLDAAAMARATISSFKKVPLLKRKSITYDNGTENQEFKLIEKKLKLNTYFAHPYSSWERGTDENTNGLIRQFYPKGTSFAMVESKQLARTVRLLNHRPRKRLGWKTPSEVFNGNALRT